MLYRKFKKSQKLPQDKNDHKPEFLGVSVPHAMRLQENVTSCVNVSLATDKDVNTTFTVICYYLIGEFVCVCVCVCVYFNTTFTVIYY